MQITKLKQSEYPDDLRDVFTSFHFCQIKQPLIQGFGNTVIKMPKEKYFNELPQFIQDLELHIKNWLESQYKESMQVKVLFFR